MHSASGGSLSIQAIVNTFSGFGQTVCETIAQLTGKGWNIGLKPMRIESTWKEIETPIPLEITELAGPCDDYEWELTIAPIDKPNVQTAGKRSIYWTMSESERLENWQTELLKRSEAIIVPTNWMREVFRKTLSVPIYVVPLGINPTIFQPTPISMGGKCIFGAGGCMSSSAKRKNLEGVIEAFSRVWPIVGEIELRLKLMPGETPPNFDKSKLSVVVNDSWMTWIDLSRWFSGLTAFVNIGPEGWGLLAHQAAASGRPVLSPLYGGATGYLTHESSYPIGYKLISGVMKASVDSLGSEMQRVYLDRKEAAEKGKLAGEQASRMTWDHMGNILEKTLLEIMR